MIDPDTMATVLDGLYKGSIVLVDKHVGFGNYVCYLPDLPNGPQGTILHESSLMCWTRVKSINIRDGSTTWEPLD